MPAGCCLGHDVIERSCVGDNAADFSPRPRNPVAFSRTQQQLPQRPSNSRVHNLLFRSLLTEQIGNFFSSHFLRILERRFALPGFDGHGRLCERAQDGNCSSCLRSGSLQGAALSPENPLAFTSALFASTTKAQTTSLWPWLAAWCNGVVPLRSTGVALALTGRRERLLIATIFVAALVQPRVESASIRVIPGIHVRSVGQQQFHGFLVPALRGISQRSPAIAIVLGLHISLVSQKQFNDFGLPFCAAACNGVNRRFLYVHLRLRRHQRFHDDPGSPRAAASSSESGHYARALKSAPCASSAPPPCACCRRTNVTRCGHTHPWVNQFRLGSECFQDVCDFARANIPGKNPASLAGSFACRRESPVAPAFRNSSAMGSP